MMKIESIQNARIKKWASLKNKKYRDQTGKFLVEGEHLIQEALSAGIVETIIYDEDMPFSFHETIQVTRDIMNKLSSNVSDVHLIAVCNQMKMIRKEMQRILILDGIQDPGNFGTLIRTAVSFSFDGIFCSKQCCDLYNEKTIRSTQGAMFHIHIERVDVIELIEILKEQGFLVVSTALQDSVALQMVPVREKMAFVLGNEGQGVSDEVRNRSDYRARIEMDGFESLNVAVAGGIVMYTFKK